MDDRQASRPGRSSFKALVASLATQARGLSGALHRGSIKALDAEDEEARQEEDKTACSSSTPESEGSPPSPSPASTPTVATRRPASGSSSATDMVTLLPWEIIDENGDVMEVVVVREKMLDIAVFRRTFVAPAGGEEEYIFQYPRYKRVVHELLGSNPILRDKLASLVRDAPAFVVTEEVFWRNFFLRCNALRVAAGVPPYLPEVKATMSSVAALASLQRFKRGVLLRKRRSTDGIVRMRRTLLARRSASADSADPTASRASLGAASSSCGPDVDLGELDLDLDGEIERELVRRRPSRTVEPVGWVAK